MAEHDEALEDHKSSDKALDAVHERAMRRFDRTVPPQLEQRTLSLAARRFVSIPGAMWEGEFGEAFCNAIKMEINLTKDGLEKIYRDYNENRIVPNFRPAGGKGDDDSAETLNGMHRADSHRYDAQQARDNAFMEGTAGGFGAWRLSNEWADPYDKDSDEQRINPGLLIADADQRVFFDPDDESYKKAKAQFAFVITAKHRETFEEDHEDAIASWPDNLPKLVYDWFSPDVVKVAEYYEVEEVNEKLYVLTHKLSGEEDRLWESELEPGELSDLKKMGWKVRARNLKRKRVHKYVLSGAEVLADKGLIAGDRIPIVPFYGKRAFVDGVERFKGYVQDKMDSNRLYNAVVSRLAETSAMSPREIPIFAASQMPPHLADLWARQVVDRHAYAVVEPLIDPTTGQIISAGAIGKVEAPQLAPVDAAILQLTQSALTDDQRDGSDEAKANTSADALEVAAARVDAKSGIFLDNMRTSVECEGEIYLSEADDVYHEEGREVETMSEDGNDGTAVLKKPTIGAKGNQITANDFSKGHYKVVADVTEATATRRDKTVRSNMNMASVAVTAQNLPMANVLLLNALMNQDGEGTGNIQKWARKQLVQMGVEDPTDEEKAQIAQAQQQPDPQADLAAAKAADLGASVKQREADAALKLAQAQAVGGPEAAPQVPDGLEAAHKVVQIRKDAATAANLETQTAHLPQKLAIEANNSAANRAKAQASVHSAKFAGLAKLFGGKGK